MPRVTVSGDEAGRSEQRALDCRREERRVAVQAVPRGDRSPVRKRISTVRASPLFMVFAV